jgi:hypothetical protein
MALRSSSVSRCRRLDGVLRKNVRPKANPPQGIDFDPSVLFVTKCRNAYVVKHAACWLTKRISRRGGSSVRLSRSDASVASKIRTRVMRRCGRAMSHSGHLDLGTQ